MIGKKLLFILIVFFLHPTPPSEAHRLRVFAFENGGVIETEAVFSGGRPAQNAEISIEDPARKTVILTGRTDTHGKFSFPLPNSVKEHNNDLNIVVSGGDGHRGQWLLKAEDYLTGPTTSPPPSLDTSPPPRVVISNQESSKPSPDLKKIIDNALDEKLAPIKRMLSESRSHKTTLQDVLGGIGYIIGLAGLAAYFRAKGVEKKTKEK